MSDQTSPKEGEWKIPDPAYVRSFRWPTLPDLELEVYGIDHPQRKPTEAYFVKVVRRSIQDVRKGDYANLWLLIDSLRNLEDPSVTSGFHSWLGVITAVLGTETCKAIGKAVCKQEGFTIEECECLREDHRKRKAVQYGLPETASWEEVVEARDRALQQELQRRRIV